MAITLSNRDVAGLETCIRALVSPWEFGSIASWRAAVRDRIGALLKADSSVSLLPLPGEPAYQFDQQPALRQYAEHYWRLDPIQNFHQFGTEAFVWPEMARRCERPDRRTWQRGEFLNEWVRPQRVCQPCGITVCREQHELPSALPHRAGVAGFWFFWNRPDPCASGERESAILRLLLPAFESGLQAVITCGRTSTMLHAALDEMGEGVVLFDERLRMVFQNRAYLRLIAEERDTASVRAACAVIARGVYAVGSPREGKASPRRVHRVAKRVLETRGGRYTVHGALLPAGALAVGPMVVVLVSRGMSSFLACDHLREGYGLTGRETVVARLVVAGYANAGIGEELGISIHTVRRHVEHILLKLGVHSRAAVAAKALAEQRPR